MSVSNGTSVLEREEQVRLVLGLLKEYAGKLLSLNEDLLEARFDRSGYPIHIRAERVAWLLDQGELLRKPLSLIISRGSAFLEHSNLDTTTENELLLRMREIEIHLHHALRLTYELKQQTDQDKHLGVQVPKLRLAAGLNAMKGGPLRPE